VFTLKIRTIGYSAGQGIKNIGRNKMFSIASIATMSACIFMFGLFFSLIMNFNYVLRNLEENVGITVFFDEGLDQASINAIGQEIDNLDEVIDMNYVSADEAWESFSEDYFEGNMQAAEGFKDNQDNPLANSAHYEVYVDRIEDQTSVVEYISGLDGVRDVKQSAEASSTLTTINRLITIISIVIIAILLAVSIFLISNTVSMGITIRREEIAIMKYIGATNAFVRMPFILEGIIIGIIGAVIPLTALYFLYQNAVTYILARFSILGEFANGLLPVNSVFILLLPVGIVLGMGIGFIGSMVTIRKHLRV
jgi:cell division transport system permease protein